MASNITYTLRNTTGSIVSIDDRGKKISASATIAITDTMSLEKIQTSDDLVTLINAGTLVLGNGTSEFSDTDAVKQLSVFSPFYGSPCVALDSSTKSWDLTINDSGVVSTTEVILGNAF